MFNIRNKDDLRLAYILLKNYELFNKCNNEKIFAKIIEIKKEIRSYFKNQERERGKIVKFSTDGHVILLPLPDSLKTVEEAEEYFEKTEVIHAMPSMYDCTGQAFTSGYKVCKRRNRFFAYHSVSLDV